MASSVTTDISSEIDRQIEEFITQMTEKEFDDFDNSAQLQKQPHTSSRFAMPKDDEAVRTAQKQAIPKGTQRSTEWACRIWDEWCKSGRIAVSIHCSDESSLDSWLSKFILEICKQDGKEYLPNTLYSIACCILRHVRNYAPQINFLIKANSMAFARHWTVK